VDELVALVRRLADQIAPEWRRIDGRLPPNGQKVLLHCENPVWTVVGYRRGRGQTLAYCLAWHPEFQLSQPTHWLPLPNLPEYGS